MDQTQVSQLTAMWERGDTASVIAAEIGKTRNAVIGKANRLKLSPRPRSGGRVKGPTKIRRQRRDPSSICAFRAAPRRSPQRPSRSSAPTKSELYAMLAEAVRNTA